jgi:NAD(P)-dependent dehydrogenase (short-subunit alcohol dehydrogenase family)
VATAKSVRTLDWLNVALKLSVDVTQPDSIHQTVGCVSGRFGRSDVLVNNAG